MAKKKNAAENPVENSEAEIKSAILNEMDEIGPGIIPDEVKEAEKKEDE